jgi:HAD superfamily hydrolase (TIGR01509 family)
MNPWLGASSRSTIEAKAARMPTGETRLWTETRGSYTDAEVKAIDPTLVDGVDLLSLDAGNTVVFLDHARLAHACTRQGFFTTADALIDAEGHAKRAHERGELIDFSWEKGTVPAARGWASTVGTMLAAAGLAREDVPRALDALWLEHCARNFWSVVPEGLVDALTRLRAAGVRVAVVSNSEGMLEQLFDEVGILRSIDVVVDSGIVGIEKPDPRIFQIALDRCGVPPARAVHVGDNFATDVLGARAAGIRVALVDPFDHLAGRHADVPRVPGAAEIAQAIAAARPR